MNNSYSDADRFRWLVADLLVVVVFSVAGRVTHGLSPLGILSTALPFLLAAILASTVAWKFSMSFWKTGLLVWLTTALLGMAFRLVLGGGFALAFLLVALGVLGLLHLGWRAFRLVKKKARN